MQEILHPLRFVVYPIIYRALYIPGGCFGFFHQQDENAKGAKVSPLYFASPGKIDW